MIIKKNSLLLFAAWLNVCFSVVAQVDPLLASNERDQTQWVDSVYSSMSLDQKIGQLFMVQVFSNQTPKDALFNENLIKSTQLGGIIFSKGDPIRQAELTNKYQTLTNLPLLIAMDAEWGLAMRLDQTHAFPFNMTFGAVRDNDLIYEVGKQIGEHCKRLGVHVNFAPVVDINTNPDNPIIGSRAFGSDKDLVIEKSSFFLKGLQSQNLLTTAKHFPGHGDTDQDSHKTLPTIDFPLNRIIDVELAPYRSLIDQGLNGVMVAHLNVPAITGQDGLPSSLSSEVVTSMLKDEMGFEGLIFSDALSMKGVANYEESGEVDLQAFLAGNDVLLMAENVPKAIVLFKKAYQSGQLSEDRLCYSVKKILKAKFKVGLNDFEPISTNHLIEDLNQLKNEALNEKVMEAALTVLANKDNILPVSDLELERLAFVQLGNGDSSTFLTTLKKYASITEIKNSNLDELNQQLKQFSTVVIGFHKPSTSPFLSYKMTTAELVELEELSRNHKVIFTVFANPYVLKQLKTIKNIEGIILAYENSDAAQSQAAQLIFGATKARGHIPVTIEGIFEEGDGLKTVSLKRLGYTNPLNVGLDNTVLQKIDSIAEYAISQKMIPGAQILVGKKGKVVYEKSFGYHTYDNSEKVDLEDIYDLASITKILGTLPLVIEMEDNGVFHLDDTLADIMPQYRGSNKAGIDMRHLLSHNAGLQSWIPFYKETLDTVTKLPIPEYFSNSKDASHQLHVAKDLFLMSSFKDSISNWILNSPLRDTTDYKYSDLTFLLLQEYVEGAYGQGLDELVQRHFLRPMGANHAGYLPLDWYDIKAIVPTEIDSYFRFQEMRGFVHDPGAAMLGGVAGHAGLFANANDVAKMMQMYLQKGFYGGKRFFSEASFDRFNTCYFCNDNNRRGLGFDKPQLEESGPTCNCVSMMSFGHSGYTGTFTWADPEEEIIYVFLSNRTYPDDKSSDLVKYNIRSEIQKVIYDAIRD